MKTVNKLMDQLTNPQMILREVKETLRACDPGYQEEENRYQQAAELLRQEVGKSVSPNAEEYLTALEQEFASDIIFAGWQGFQLNLECFKNPVNKLLLREDFECLLMEHQMPVLPMARTARQTISAFTKALSPEQKHLTEDIIDYYAYLQTYAYKLAHCFGFQLADQFLHYVVPGYSSNPVAAIQYTSTLCNHLQIDHTLFA